MLDPETISERIHDADSETNEAMVHWLHMFMVGDLDKEKLKEKFIQAYETEEGIRFPWIK